MNESMSNGAMLHSIWTVLLVIVFVGVIAWAWSSRRKRGFDAAARLPLEEDQPQDDRKPPHG